ncbi:ABC transporter ATP-binding protein [Pseudorhodobacter aquimaris]|uniref:ABC transporter ATP-binding protein n=1 Tax=Pseudorhodobacter aquimaris TaxID=687412 RepID=UPI00067C56B9|nr:ABC transporter ATP-binding protein [Pseudorhodobacter aquimaris]
MTESVRIQNLVKAFDNPDKTAKPVLAVDTVSLDIKPGELVTLLGPSGCGKTTLLRMVAGFEEPTAGEIYFGDRHMNNVPPNRRDATMVFQSYAIFPHLSIFENVAFGLRLKSLKTAALEKRVTDVLDMVGLSGMANRSPNQLSGGQQQRVALARAIVMEPRLLLFDEPLSNLDAKLRDQMRVEIRELQQRLGITSLYVTHDQIEAMSISDRIVIMRGGKVEQVGTPREIYAQPANRFVAEFIGRANFMSAKVVDQNTVSVAGTQLAVATPLEAAPGTDVTLLIRPEFITLSASEGMLAGSVKRVMFLGNLTEYLVEVPGTEPWLIELSGADSGIFAVGETVNLSLPAAALHVLME